MTGRLQRDWPQIEGVTVHQGDDDDGRMLIDFPGDDPDPDAAAIIAQAVGADDTEDPPPFGLVVPAVQTVPDLPIQPPGMPDRVVLLAYVRSPVPDRGLYVYNPGPGTWTAL